MNRWRYAGFIATIIIILTIPLYLLRMESIIFQKENIQPGILNSFVGSRKCMDCHKQEYDKWFDSHHDHAMEVANSRTVLGDFNNAVFEIHGVTSRFYKKEDRYFVHTQGTDGEMAEYEVTHTFGWYPLQQYLVPFPGGRLQCLPIAWDVREKQWYNLSPEEVLDPDDWLYWTNAGQNWNGMCAECHSTNLKKNYDLSSDTYNTTWTDIDVGCEACHGPGSRHIEWAEMPDMARPNVKNYNLAVRTTSIDSRELVEICAPCHSRRAILGDYTHAEPDLLDSLLPVPLNPGLYFPDGQILEEVYVYGSFTQSKMYHRDVRCSDCHDVHSTRLVKEGNHLCLQCHRADEYDLKDHHFHKMKGEAGEPVKSDDGSILFEIGSGSECIRCHMPGRIYMGIDYRPDHSFRIPRPDLSIKIETPNACNRCHVNQTAEWSEEHISKWYGPGRKRHYGSNIEAARNLDPDAYGNLLRLAVDPLYPVIVRSTSLTLLRAYPDEETAGIFEIALMDDEALIRRTAIESLNVKDINRLVNLVSPLLYDPVKAVRIEAAAKLAGEPSKHLDERQQKVFRTALDEYVSAMEYSGDFAFGRYNLGNLYSSLKKTGKAIENYEAAIKIDNLFYPAKVNLAMLYNSLGDNDSAEKLFRDVVTEHPNLFDIAYSLGLLLVEKGNYDDAVKYLKKASEGMPERARVHYNLGLLLQQLGYDTEAEEALKRAYEKEMASFDYLYALADFYLKRSRYNEAKHYVEQIVNRYPDMPIGKTLLEYINEHSISLSD
jgi:Tfp pilus assembly protein PilF